MFKSYGLVVRELFRFSKNIGFIIKRIKYKLY